MKTMRRWAILVFCLLASSFCLAPRALAQGDTLQYRGQMRPTGWPEMPPSFQGKRTRGETVKIIQFLLRARGYKIKADGVFGAQTETAVRAFQKRSKLKVDGIVGQRTWPRLVQTLKRGSRGDAVRAAQLAMKIEGYEIKVDSIFGAETERIVRSAQEDYGLKIDGIIGPKTWAWIVGGTA